jgi:hypothetical protein
MLEHEAAHLLAMDALGLDRCSAGAHQIPHRLVTLVRDPNRSEFTGPKEPRQSDRVTPIGLHSITWLRISLMVSNDFTRW